MPGRKNSNLHAAKKNKNDEFYTQLKDIEDELVHYRDHFRGKTIFLNCDDPEMSNFWKWFALRFDNLGLKKLIATHYEPGKSSYKLEMSREGGYSPAKTPLEGDGDFRSPECVALLDEADIVVTNPPFSLFREYIAQLIEHDKKFLIIGNQNAITYKEVFPLLKDGVIWLGNKFGGMSFEVPPEYDKAELASDGKYYRELGNICWYTNLDHEKRHVKLVLGKRYRPALYPKYDNYDAIEVGALKDIPRDYVPGWLVPIGYKEQLLDAGFKLGMDRLNSAGEKCVCVTSRRTSHYEDSSENKCGMVLGHHGRADNVPRQVQLRTVRDSRGRFYSCGSCNDKRERKAQSTTDVREWGETLCSYLDLSSKLEWCSGVMGVPITFLDKYNPNQFEILGFWNAGVAGESIGAEMCEAISAGKLIRWNGPTVDGKTKYFRILIRRK